nr:DUF3524 domain-containing protein [Gilvimarinus xylanilyticus]
MLLSGYDADSHKRWRQGLSRHLPAIDFTHIALPPRYFSWRIRGNSLSFAGLHAQALADGYDCLVATSMVDLSSLRGMVPALSQLPTLLYFHENQFAYPQSKHQSHSVEPQIVSLYSALCADTLAFNSDYNRCSFMAGAEALLKKLPDLVPPGIVEKLQQKSVVLPVPIESEWFRRPEKARQAKLQLVWNHRWEYDKNPELLYRALQIICREHNGKLPFVLHLVGQRFRQVPPVFTQIRDLLTAADGLGQWGYVESAEQYRQLLRRCDLVVSTADHDFQGLAVLEAVASGCIPVLPERQVYPEYFGDGCYPVSGDCEADARNLAVALAQHLTRFNEGRWPAPPDVSCFSWNRLGPDYGRVIKQLATQPPFGAVL